MLQESLLADMLTEQPAAIRLQNVVNTLRRHFHCGAVVLLKLDNDALQPVAMQGLVKEALGRRFMVTQHPRLASLLASRSAIRFAYDSSLPDPYDGLLFEKPGNALAVHDCMGISLYLENKCWGVLTLDALQPGTFSDDAILELQTFSLFVETAIRIGQLEQNVRALRQGQQPVIPQAGRCESNDSEIIGQSKVINDVLKELRVVASADLPVLLLGETGVGKELFARQLHLLSQRSDKALIYVNCAALPESLAESELFGHVKGAFSGATGDRAGRFEAAHGGTLFLDEVGELPLSIQAKLLRVLQNGEIQRLGSDKYRKVDVRLITATNRNLRQQVGNETFRADLYHRLSVYPLLIPPLRERDEDISILAGYFLELNRTRLGLRALRLSPESELAIQQYQWPGNVRELEHAISRAAIKLLSHGVEKTDIATIEPQMLDLDVQLPLSNAATINETDVVNALTTRHISMKEAVNYTQRKMITAALSRHNNRWSQAAKDLQLDASNLHKMADRLGMK